MHYSLIILKLTVLFSDHDSSARAYALQIPSHPLLLRPSFHPSLFFPLLRCSSYQIIRITTWLLWAMGSWFLRLVRLASTCFPLAPLPPLLIHHLIHPRLILRHRLSPRLVPPPQLPPPLPQITPTVPPLSATISLRWMRSR